MRHLLTTATAILTALAITSAAADDKADKTETGAVRYGYLFARCKGHVNFPAERRGEQMAEFADYTEAEVAHLAHWCNEQALAKANGTQAREMKDPPSKVVERRPPPPAKVVEKMPTECVIRAKYRGPNETITLWAVGGSVKEWEKEFALVQGENFLKVPCNIVGAEELTFDCICGKWRWWSADDHLGTARKAITPTNNVMNPDLWVLLDGQCPGYQRADSQTRHHNFRKDRREKYGVKLATTGFQAKVTMGFFPNRPVVRDGYIGRVQGPSVVTTSPQGAHGAVQSGYITGSRRR